MSEKRYIHIRNWDRFQHYKKRGAPWIKDYTEQLRNEEWIGLTFRQRGLLQGLRLLYAAKGWQGIGCSPARIGTMLGDDTVRMRDLEALNHAGFIVISASKVLATRKQDASPEEETEIEEEIEQDQGLTAPKGAGKSKGPGSQSQTPGEPHDHSPTGRIRTDQENANGHVPAPSEAHGPLGDAIRDELARTQPEDLPVW